MLKNKSNIHNITMELGTLDENVNVIRDDLMLESLVIIDGQPGSGKSLIAWILSAMERIELLNYCGVVEDVCALKYLNKITNDAAETMISKYVDLLLYWQMMSRGTNFRPSDTSSVFKSIKWLKYVKRLFQKGDELIPGIIKKEKPILNFTTHNTISFSLPIFKSLNNKVILIEVVRHPLYMLIQQTLNHERHNEHVGYERMFHHLIKYNNQKLPWWNYGQEEIFLKSNSVERAIYEMQNITNLSENKKITDLLKYKSQILTIPFELFVTKPFIYLYEIERILSTKITNKTKKMMRKQNVPRSKFADGIPFKVHKRCGWDPPVKGFTERDELNKRRSFAVEQGASKNALDILDKMSFEYENKYLKGLSI